MTSTSNMLSNTDTILNTELKNKGFVFLDTLFNENGWKLIKNELNWICYTKFGHETELFDINKQFGYYTLNSIKKEHHSILDVDCWVINIGCHKIDEFVINDFVKLNNW